jgi:hypothetical protein
MIRCLVRVLIGARTQVCEYHEADADTLAYHLLRRDAPAGAGGTAVAPAIAAGGGLTDAAGLAPAPAVTESSYEGSWV